MNHYYIFQLPVGSHVNVKRGFRFRALRMALIMAYVHDSCNVLLKAGHVACAQVVSQTS